MPCNITPKQAKDFFEDPKLGAIRVAGLWDKAIEYYSRNGMDFVETVNALASDTGMPKQSLLDVLLPKGSNKAITNEMWLRQAAKRQIGESVKRVAASAGSNNFVKAYKAYDSATRGITTLGHFTVFGKTHAGDSLWTNPVEYAKNFKNSLHLATKEGMALHEERMTRTYLDDDYALAVRSGLDVTARNEASQVLGAGKSLRAHAAFEELQLRRFEAFKKALVEPKFALFKKIFRSLSPEERNVDNAKPIAEIINNRLGGGAPGRIGGFFGKFLFGPRLTPAQWRAAYVDNVRAFYNGVINRRNATPGEIVASRMVATRMGKLLVTYGGVLGLEAAYAKATGDEKNMPNFTNPADTGSFMRVKIAGKGIPLSPTMELISLPIRMIYAGLHAKSGENPYINALEPLAKYGLFRLSPGLSLGATLATGQEPFSGRQLPDAINIRKWTGTAPPEKTKKGQPTMASLTHPKLTYTEFLGERMPIPVAVFLRDAYDEARADGMDAPTAKNLLQASLAAATTGTTGYEWHPDVPTPYKQAELNTPENASDKQRAAILRKAMKDFKRQRSGQPAMKEGFGIGQ